MRLPRFLVAVLAALPLSACLDYDVNVRTAVAPDGSVTRTVFIHEKSKDHDTWDSFAKPGDAYALSGSDADGFTATAAGEAGTMPSGLRVALDDQGNFVEGDVRVDVEDLVLGTMYRYEERFALGVDPELVRDEAGPMLEVLLDTTVAVLRKMEPDVDFFPVYEVARERVLPRVEASLLIMQQAVAAYARDHREHVLREVADPGDEEAQVEFDGLKLHLGRIADDPRLRLCLSELARFGVVRRETDEGTEWSFEPFVLDELLRPVSDLSDAQRAALIGRILDEKEFGELWNTTWQERHPKGAEETLALEARGARLAAGIAGVLFWRGIADGYDVRFRVQLPGTLLYTNGELGELPAASWRLDSGDCAFANPVLTAVSFVPYETLPKGGWSLKELDALRVALDALPQDKRAAVARVYAATRSPDDETAAGALLGAVNEFDTEQHAVWDRISKMQIDVLARAVKKSVAEEKSNVKDG